MQECISKAIATSITGNEGTNAKLGNENADHVRRTRQREGGNVSRHIIDWNNKQARIIATLIATSVVSV